MSATPSEVQPISQWRVYAHTLLEPLRIIRRDALAMTGFIILLLLLLVALAAPLIATHDPHAMHSRVEGMLLRISATSGQRHEVIAPLPLNAVVQTAAGAKSSCPIVAAFGLWVLRLRACWRWAVIPLSTNCLPPHGITGSAPRIWGVTFSVRRFTARVRH